MGVFYTSAGLRYLLDQLVMPTTPVVKDGGTTSASAVITSASTTGLAVGMVVIGAGIPAGSKIISIVPGVSFTISHNATATATVPIVAYDPFAGNLDVRLITAGPALTDAMVWADFTEASYNGYAAVPADTWTTILSRADYSLAVMDCINFTPTDYLVPNTIIGHAWTWDTGAGPDVNLLAVELYETPVELAAAGDALNVTPILPLANDLTAGPSSPIITS